MQLITALVDDARAVLARFIADPAHVVTTLRPKPDDYARVFVAHVVPIARAAYETMWLAPELPVIADASATLDVSVAYASDLDQSPAFPGGYSTIARLLQPDIAWACWRCVRPGEVRGTIFDGLVRVTDRWAWFPKPYRVLGQQVHPLSYYSE